MYSRSLLITIILLIHINAVGQVEVEFDELIEKAQEFTDNEDFHSAEKELIKAQNIAKNEYGKESETYAWVLDQLAFNISFQPARFRDAEKLFIEAVAIFEKSNGKDLDYYSSSLESLAELYLEEFQFKQALQRYQELNDILGPGENVASYYRPLKIRIIYGIAKCNNSIPNNDLSHDAFKDALELCSRWIYRGEWINPKGKPRGITLTNPWLDPEDLTEETRELLYLYSDILDYYAHLLIFEGTFTEAESLLKESGALISKIYGEESADYGIHLSDFSDLYFHYNLIDKAEELNLKSAKIISAQFGENSAEFAWQLISLSDIESSKGNYKIAEGALLKAEYIFNKTYVKETLAFTDLYIRLGQLNQELGNFGKAKKYYRKADEITIKWLGPNHPSRPLNDLANLSAITGDLDRAITLTEEAITIAGTEDDACLSCELYNLGLYQYYQEKYFDSFQNLIKSNELALKLYSLGAETMTESERVQYLINYTSRWETFNALMLDTNEQIPESIAANYDLVLSTKGLMLDQASKITSTILSSGDEQLMDMYDRWIAQKKHLSELYSSQYENRESIDKAERTADLLEKELIIESRDFETLKMNKVSWMAIRDKLKENEAAIEIIRFNYQDDSVVYAALIVKPTVSNPELVVLPDGNAMESIHAKYYRNNIKFKVQDKKSYGVYWEPIAKKLQDINTVYFSPDGIYHNISLSGLYNSASQDYLIDRWDVQRVVSTREIVASSNDVYWNEQGFIIGYPAFNQNGKLNTEVKELIESDSSQRFFNGDNISDLPGTLIEIQTLEEILDSMQYDVKILSHSEATESNLKKVDSPKLLHIATHGYFLNEIDDSIEGLFMGQNIHDLQSNPFLRSGLLLSNAKQAITGGGDGILTAFEAANLSLQNTDLVVLSACETGLGEIQKGEGVIGLQRAFRLAGANSVVMSLWTVSDDATQKMMTLFYDFWLIQEMSKREAFRQAQLKVKEEYPHPYYWAPFVMVGFDSGQPTFPNAIEPKKTARLDVFGWSEEKYVSVNKDLERILIFSSDYGAAGFNYGPEIFDFSGKEKANLVENYNRNYVSEKKTFRIHEQYFIDFGILNNARKMEPYKSFSNGDEYIQKIKMYSLDGEVIDSVNIRSSSSMNVHDVSPDQDIIVGTDRNNGSILKLWSVKENKKIKDIILDEVINGITLRARKIIVFTPSYIYYYSLQGDLNNRQSFDGALFKDQFYDQFDHEEDWTSNLKPPRISRQVFNLVRSYERGNKWMITNNFLLISKAEIMDIYELTTKLK